ncbi:Thiamine-binding periplasmic protein [Nymphon striatum]|nr:Thiamine-binding periplasmic protein [Nymphon striatum]
MGSNAFAFSDMNGKKDSINNHIGKDKWTIVEIWESSCAACRMHMPEMVKFDGKLKNARLLGISLDGLRGIDDAEDFIAEYDVKFPTILTNYVEMNIWMEQSIGESLRGTPTFILFDPEGKLVAAQPGIVSVASLEKFITQNSTESTAQRNHQLSLKALIEDPNSPKILIQDPRTSTPGLGLLLWVKKVYGDQAADAWKKLAPRIVTVSKGWSEAYGLFLKDEAPLVLSYTTSPAYHIIAEGKNNFAAAKFSEGHYQQIEVAGMIATSKNKTLAKKFLVSSKVKLSRESFQPTNWMYPAALAKTELPEAFNTLIDPEPCVNFLK